MRPRRSGSGLSPIASLGSPGQWPGGLRRGVGAFSGLVLRSTAPPRALEPWGAGIPSGPLSAPHLSFGEAPRVGLPSPASAPDGASQLAPAFATHLSAWRQYNACLWVISVLDFGCRLLFSSRPPHFQGVLEKKVIEKFLSVILAENVSALLNLGAAAPAAPLNRLHTFLLQFCFGHQAFCLPRDGLKTPQVLSAIRKGSHLALWLSIRSPPMLLRTNVLLLS